MNLLTLTFGYRNDILKGKISSKTMRDIMAPQARVLLKTISTEAKKRSTLKGSLTGHTHYVTPTPLDVMITFAYWSRKRPSKEYKYHWPGRGRGRYLKTEAIMGDVETNPLAFPLIKGGTRTSAFMQRTSASVWKYPIKSVESLSDYEVVTHARIFPHAVSSVERVLNRLLNEVDLSTLGL